MFRQEKSGTTSTFGSGWSRPPRVPPPRSASVGSHRSSCSTDSVSSRSSKSTLAPGYDSIGASRQRPEVQQCRGTSPLRKVPLQEDQLPALTEASVSQLASLVQPGRKVSIGSDTSETHSLGSSSCGQSTVLSAAGLSASGLRHEGWLSKRTSHTMVGGLAARWQCRYWVLKGSKLSYHKVCGGVPLRSFNLRRMQHIDVVDGCPHEFEMDFGVRVWRLRAEDSPSARRWVHILDAARLVCGGNCVGADDSACSDDDSASTASLADSAASMCHLSSDESSQPSSAERRQSMMLTNSSKENNERHGMFRSSARKFVPSSVQRMLSSVVHTDAMNKDPELLSAAYVADKLEVDPDALDKQFDAWFKDIIDDAAAVGVETPHFGSNRSSHSDLVRAALSNALSALWHSLGGTGPESVVAAWKRPLKPDADAFGDAADALLSEYISRIFQNLERWIQKCDPAAEELADVATWFLFDALPGLRQFELLSTTELQSKCMPTWQSSAHHLETMLLGEWESRSCDLMSLHMQQAFTVPSLEHSGSEHHIDMDAVLQMLTELLDAEIWKGHAAAEDRSMSVFIAALNAAFRCHRRYVRDTLGNSLRPEGSDELRISRGRRQKMRWGDLLAYAKQHGASSCIKEGTSSKSSRLLALAIPAVAAAAQFRSFCHAGRSSTSAVASNTTCREVLCAFERAFERESVRLSMLVADAGFALTHRHTLKSMKFGASGPHNLEEPMVLSSCEVARGFLDEMLDGPNSPGGAQVCDGIVRIIVDYWIRALRRDLSHHSLQRADFARRVSADEVTIVCLAATFGALALWDEWDESHQQALHPLSPMWEVRHMLEHPQTASESLERIETVLGAGCTKSLAKYLHSCS